MAEIAGLRIPRRFFTELFDIIHLLLLVFFPSGFAAALPLARCAHFAHASLVRASRRPKKSRETFSLCIIQHVTEYCNNFGAFGVFLGMVLVCVCLQRKTRAELYKYNGN
jgi:hypothetical protein